MKRRNTVIIAIAAVAVLGIGFGAGMAAKSTLAAEGKKIDVNEAKAIALANVGVSEEKATFTKAKLDDDGHYEIDFYTASTEYDFEIDKKGNVLEKDSEPREAVKPEAKKQKEQQAQAQSQQSQQSQSKPASSSNDSSVIGVSSAKSIALKHAGVSSASFTKAYLDHDDGIRVYELEFTAGGYEYDYEINAYSGAIRSCDKERIEYEDKYDHDDYDDRDDHDDHDDYDDDHDDEWDD